MNIPGIRANYTLHNHFNLTVRDAHTKEVKQTAEAYNVVLDRFYAGSTPLSNLRSIQIGTGSGTPASSDIALFARKYTLSSSSYSVDIIDDNTCRVTTTVTSPLGNTGAFTEIGMGSTLFTHALLSDSEGNPITVTQTSTDIIDITAITFFTLTISDDAMEYPIKPSVFIYRNLVRYSTSTSSTLAGLPILPYNIGMVLATNINRQPSEAGLLDTESLYAHGVRYNMPDNVSGPDMLTGSQFAAKGVNYRMGTTVGNDAYYNFYAMTPMGCYSIYSNYARSNTTPFCYTKFPNYNVFPRYPIERITVGVGDGTTTTFDSPVPMFIPNSETLRQNGLVRTRGTHYTIDHKQNVDENISATPGNIAIISGGVNANIARYVPFTVGTFITDTGPNLKYALSQNNPLLITLDNTDATIGMSVNYLKLGSFISTVTSSAAQLQNAVFTLLYSADGVTYSEAALLTVGDNLATQQTVEFNTVSAQYWKLSVDLTACSLYTRGTLTADTPLYQNAAGASVLGYKGSPITFMTPPAAGDVIEMDIEIDRPYKTNQYVIDLAGTYTIGG